MSFKTSNFIKNSAEFNGGCFNLKENNDFTLECSSINNCIFNYTIAGLNGGIFYVFYKINLTLSNLHFENSFATSLGGSIYCG